MERGLRTARSPELILQEGILKIKGGNASGARNDAEELLKQNPDDSRAARLLINSYSAQNQLPLAVDRIRRLASERPKSAEIQFELGQVLVASGNRGEGKVAFEASRVADENFVPARMALAEMDGAEQKWDSARENLNAVKAREPRNLAALIMLADIELITGNRAAAIERYRSVLEVNGSHIGALNNLAYLLIPESPDEALTIAQKALELAPDDPNVTDTLGWIYYRKGSYQTAIRHLKVAVDKAPTARSQYHLALSYLKAGDRDLGSKMLATALKQDPNFQPRKAPGNTVRRFPVPLIYAEC